jgi:hypothetical protein
MGKLAGFRYREIVRRLKLFGYEFYRQAAGSHEPKSGSCTALWEGILRANSPQRRSRAGGNP